MTARLEVSAGAFQANIAAVRDRIDGSELMLVMKDDAYGHGLDWAVAEAVDAGVRWIGSYDVVTALRVRAVAPDMRIFAWATSSADEVAEAIRARVDLGVGTLDYLRRVITEARAAGERARVHLKIDTGLHRNGIRPEQWRDAVAVARAAEDEGALEIAGVWSHLAEASDAEDDQARREFDAAVQALRDAGGTPEYLHLTASAASWWRPELRGTMCRIGAFCYGIRSADGPELDGIRPITALRAVIEERNDDRAVIGLGSLDGLPSSLSGAPIADGTVRLARVEETSSEISGASLAVGESVAVFGPDGVSATDLAERIDTVGEEILTRLSPLLPRVYV